MMGWWFLVGAIALEVSGTVSLRIAILKSRAWFIGVALAYLLSFFALSLALGTGIPLGVAYGVWAASGVALTAVLGRLIFKEPLTLVMMGGILLIIGGVLLVETGASR